MYVHTYIPTCTYTHTYTPHYHKCLLTYPSCLLNILHVSPLTVSNSAGLTVPHIPPHKPDSPQLNYNTILPQAQARNHHHPNPCLISHLYSTSKSAFPSKCLQNFTPYHLCCHHPALSHRVIALFALFQSILNIAARVTLLKRSFIVSLSYSNSPKFSQATPSQCQSLRTYKTT